MKQFLNTNIFYPNMMYPIQSIQQPKFIPSMMPQENQSIEKKLNSLKNRAIQLFFDGFGLTVVYVAYAIVISAMDPYNRNYSCNMAGLSFPKVQEFVPLYALLMFGIIGPIVLIVLVEMFNSRLYPFQGRNESLKARFKKFLIITMHSIILFTFGVGVIILLTAIAQRWVSKLRPNFIAICKPASNLNCITTQVGVSASGSVFNSISTGGTFCTGLAADIKESRMSFPSGHSSFATFTMLFLVIYLQARLVTLRFRSLRPLLQTTAIIAALVTSVSRYIDYYADGWDILGGAVLGALIAVAFTIYLGRVLWDYEKKIEYSEFQLQPQV